MQRPPGVIDFEPSPRYYPFASRWFDGSVGPVHYIDEGAGRPLLLLHGNPDWSFLYRTFVSGLSGRFRCVVPDYPGFGLSIHPPEPYRYTPAEHASVILELVEHLDLQDAVVMRRLAVEPEAREVVHPSVISSRRHRARCDQTSPSTRCASLTASMATMDSAAQHW